MSNSGPSTGLGRRYWTLWSAFTSTNLGDGLTLVGFPLLAIQITDDPRLIALVSAFRFLPFLTIGLPAGVVIDRFDRRKIAMLAQVLRSTTVALIGLLVLTDTATIPLLAAGAFIVGVGEVMTDGGLPAVVRDVVDTQQLEDANGRLRASQTVSNNFIGPPVGAALFAVDASLPFLGAGLLYVATIALLAALPGDFRPEQPVDDASFLLKIRQGLAYVWNHPVLRPLALAVALFSFFGQAGNAVLVVLATDRLGLSEFQFGLLITVDAVASVAMALVLGRFIRRTSHGTSMKLSVVMYASQAVLLGTVTFLPLIVLALVFGGISDPTWNVVSATVRQRLVDDQIFGRAMTAYLFIAWSFNPVGAMFGGFIADALGPEWVYLIGGAAVASLLVLARPMFRLIDAAFLSASPTATQP